MDRSHCWRFNYEVADGVVLSDGPVHPFNAVFCAATRRGRVISVYYRFRYAICKSTLVKLLPDFVMLFPVKWSHIRRWLMDSSEERIIVKGLAEYPLSDDTKALQVGVVAPIGTVLLKKKLGRVRRRLDSLIGLSGR